MKTVPIANHIDARDILLKDFTCGQRDYIIHKLYPIIKKTLVHFIAEATRENEIVERPEEQKELPEAKVEQDKAIT